MLQLPKDFIDSISCCAGFDETAFKEALNQSSPTSIRINPFKKANLKFDSNDSVSWNDKGFYLNERPSFTYDVLFQAGCYYVQEAGSMFIEHALKSCVDFNQSLNVFDVCASPGGKSTLLNSLLSEESMLVANEVVKQRSDVLAQNVTKWGTSNVIVTNNDPSAFSDINSFFDVIVVDAPCSGSGLFRKQHDAVDEWSLDNVNLCSQRQKRILSDVVNSLNDNGILVYSTCSYSKSENEDIADWLIAEFELETVHIPIDAKWGIVETTSDVKKAKGYRFYPDKTKSEGFFCSVFRKIPQSSNGSNHRKIKNEIFKALKTKDKEVFKNWVFDIEHAAIIKFKDDNLLVNQSAIDFINKYNHLYFKKVGTNLGTVIKNELVPHHDLALSIHQSDAIEKIVCDEVQAIQFLKKELSLIQGHKGWNLMTYQGFGIGWIKHLGNRINNYLPNEFRILK
jgi:16S rRNA C967 or C1407 C5-methylase (RsmB/RsmF family)/NOL1/NOP2/fmu family ribosome biogenesis protein